LRDVTDDVTNRLALEESRTRYKAIYDDASIAHCIILSQDNSFNNGPIRIINANHAAIRLFHADNQQHLIHAFSQLISHQTDSLQQNIQLALSEKRNWSEFELKVTDFLGKDLVLWVNVSFYASSDQHALITFIDMTERNKATEELYQREQFWAKIMDQTVDMIYVLSLDDSLVPHVEYRNSSINKLFGLPEPTNTSTIHANLKFHPDDHEKTLRLMKKTRHLSAAETVVETCRVKDSKGYWRIIRFTNIAFDFDSAGLVCRYISSIRDVTEEEEQKIILIENERRYRLLAENVVDVIWAVNSDLDFTFISSSIYSMLGYRPDEIYRGAIRSVISQGDLKKLNKRIQVALKKSLEPENKGSDFIFKLDIQSTCQNGPQLISEIQAH
jgi:PAS domain S-box-containing protein